MFRSVSIGMVVALASMGMGQTDFSVSQISQVSSPDQLRAGAGAMGTHFINGMAVVPSPTGDLFAIHTDSSQQETFLRIDPATGDATKITDVPAIAAQLGSPYSNTMTPVAGFAYGAAVNKLYFAENFNGGLDEVSVIAIEASTGLASLVTRSGDIDGLNDFAMLTDGSLVGVTGEEGGIGILDTISGSWTMKVDEEDILAASPGATELPPESVGASVGTGEVFVFCHDDLDLFQIPDITSATPTLNRMLQPELADVDLHDVVADEEGNLFGFDEHGEQILIVRKDDGAVFTLSFEDIETALSGAGSGLFSPSLWRGLAVRSAGNEQVDLFIASFTSEYGITRVRFGGALAAVDEWQLY